MIAPFQINTGVDPNLFHLNWERTFEGLALVIILAFVVERVLALLFESKPFIVRMDHSGVKEVIAAVVSIVICVSWQFDVISVMILTPETTDLGYALTGLLIAGGSKASIKLFHDLLNVKSTTYAHRYAITAEHSEAKIVAAKRKIESKDNIDDIAKLEAQGAKWLAIAEVAAMRSGGANTKASGIAARASQEYDELRRMIAVRTQNVE